MCKRGSGLQIQMEIAKIFLLQDGHRLLGYKILCGHVWSYEHCRHVKHVAKSDDNVHVDMDRLTRVLQADVTTDWKNLITCPTLCFGMKVHKFS